MCEWRTPLSAAPRVIMTRVSGASYHVLAWTHHTPPTLTIPMLVHTLQHAYTFTDTHFDAHKPLCIHTTPTPILSRTHTPSIRRRACVTHTLI